MCQLCQIPKISSRFIWPVPLRPHVTSLTSQCALAHEAISAHNSAPTSNKAQTLEHAKNATRPILTTLSNMEEELKTWWAEPRKVELRREWDRNIELGVRTDENRMKKAELNSILARAKGMITEMSVKAGFFCKHTLGVDAKAL